MKTSRKAKFLLFISLLFFSGVLVYIFIPVEVRKNEINSEEDEVLIVPTKLKMSATLSHNITIDDSATGVGAHNWTWAVTQAWCSGSGTAGDPYLIDSQDIYINNTATACINISNSHSVYFTISNLIVRNNASDYGIGIALDNCYNGTINTVTASSNGDDGIYLINCRNITIVDSIMNSNHHYGLNMDNTTISTVTTVTMNFNDLGGAYLVNSTYNIFQTNCNLNNNTDGLILIDSDLNNITSCKFYNNTDNGIEILNSDSCIIITNDVEDNIGIGIYIYDEAGDSQLNKLYGNDFDTNTKNAEDNSTGTGNTWDNGVDSGNQWDDYSGADLDDDGIGDDPYNVSGSASAQDNYPVWDDGDSIAPVISIILPVINTIYLHPPQFSLVIVEAVGISKRWYTVDNGAHNYTFTGTSGIIDLTEWSRITGSPGTTIAARIIFYVNDTTGNIGRSSVGIYKTFYERESHGEDTEPEEVELILAPAQYMVLALYSIVVGLIMVKRILMQMRH